MPATLHIIVEQLRSVENFKVYKLRHLTRESRKIDRSVWQDLSIPTRFSGLCYGLFYKKILVLQSTQFVFRRGIHYLCTPEKKLKPPLQNEYLNTHIERVNVAALNYQSQFFTRYSIALFCSLTQQLNQFFNNQLTKTNNI